MTEIRKATQEDMPAIAEFQIKMAMETEGLALLPETVEDGVKAVFDKPGRGQYWVATSDSKVIASLLVTYEWSDWRNAEVWWLQSVYVEPQFRRMGIFSKMYGYVKAEAERYGATGLRLYVEANNVAAQKTYEAAGMKSGHYLLYEWLKQG
ncbi:MAG: GNAT family N-acetyltransferase [Bacteroidales bacterium]|jgi:ribosomal protein S18 acetylase RimI-like enzyme|nr:GNAT family N-acetyltransferase [Bacteroidales bacterium]